MYTAMKIGGMVLVIACTTSIGISFARALTERVRELERTLAALSSLGTELSYSLAPPAEAVAKLDERETESAAFIPACASLCRRGKPFPQAWREAALMWAGGRAFQPGAYADAFVHAVGYGARPQRDTRPPLPDLGVIDWRVRHYLFYLRNTAERRENADGRRSDL